MLQDVPRHSEGKSLSQWAVKVDVNALVEDFDRRVPNMAHTVCVYYTYVHLSYTFLVYCLFGMCKNACLVYSHFR